MSLVDAFILTHLREEGRIGRFSDFIIFIRDDEGQIPHFHFINKQAKKKQPKEGCICLEEPMYFIHPGKTATLNHTGREDLVKFLLKPSRSMPSMTNYAYICRMWNLYNPKSPQVNECRNMPDYTNIEKNK